MEAKAIAKYVRMSSSKLKPVADLVRGKDLNEALTILKFQPGKASELIEKVVMSAAANAENNHEMNPDALYVAELSANQGPTMKRWRPGAQGRAGMILKRTSHISVVLKEREELLEKFAAIEAAKKEEKAAKKNDAKKETAKKEETKAEEPKKEEAKKAPAKKPAAKKTETAKKPAAKKETAKKPAAKKPAAKKETKKEEVR